MNSHPLKYFLLNLVTFDFKKNNGILIFYGGGSLQKEAWWNEEWQSNMKNHNVKLQEYLTIRAD